MEILTKETQIWYRCRLLKALGAPSDARLYIAGGEPFGGAEALQPLVAKFRNVVTREMLAREGELSPYENKSSSLTAIDYIVSLSSNVFIPSHGGNMGRVMQVISGLEISSKTSIFIFTNTI